MRLNLHLQETASRPLPLQLFFININSLNQRNYPYFIEQATNKAIAPNMALATAMMVVIIHFQSMGLRKLGLVAN